MRHFVSSLLIIILFLSSIPTVWGTRIETSQKWGKRIQRSIVPSPPVLYIEGNILTVEFVDPLSNLTIYVINSVGQIVHEECTSSDMSGNLYDIPLSVEEGEYQLVLSQYYGEIQGCFTIKN